MRYRTGWMLVLTITVLLTTLGCSLTGLIARPRPTPTPTRTPRPTFTPTPVTPELTEMQPTQAGPTPTPAAPTPTPEPPTPTPIPTPFAVISADLVNLRAGPGTNYPRVGTAKAGQTFTITGKNPAGDWWEICCIGEKKVWIFSSLVQAQGPLHTVQIAANIPPPPPTPRPTPTPIPQPTPTPAPQYAFNAGGVEARTNTNPWVSIWGRLFNRAGNGAVGGYKLRILRGGATVAEGTFDSIFSRAYPGLDSEFIYNAKIELHNFSDGQYTAQLLDGSGQPAGPDQTFTVSGTTREFLITWRQR
ncbi:MAG: SH3 domain-containing protein [Chloroflexi bacterium]|nr:SH3 domain-containing protein [Chloroflexota bacterium]